MVFCAPFESQFGWRPSLRSGPILFLAAVLLHSPANGEWGHLASSLLLARRGTIVKYWAPSVTLDRNVEIYPDLWFTGDLTFLNCISLTWPQPVKSNWPHYENQNKSIHPHQGNLMSTFLTNINLLWLFTLVEQKLSTPAIPLCLYHTHLKAHTPCLWAQ